MGAAFFVGEIAVHGFSDMDSADDAAFDVGFDIGQPIADD